MLVGAKVCELTEDLLWFVCVLYAGILTSSLSRDLEVLLWQRFCNAHNKTYKGFQFWRDSH